MISALFPTNVPTEHQAYTQKHQAIIHLFKEYHEDEGIQSLLKQSVLAILSKTKPVRLYDKLSDYEIDQCLPCSAITKIIIDSKVFVDLIKKLDIHQVSRLLAIEVEALTKRLDISNPIVHASLSEQIEDINSVLRAINELKIPEDLTEKSQNKLSSLLLKKIQDNLPLLTIKEMPLLLSISPFKELFNNPSHIVSYESVINLSGINEFNKNDNQPLSFTEINEFLDRIASRDNASQTLLASGVNFIINDAGNVNTASSSSANTPHGFFAKENQPELNSDNNPPEPSNTP